jgi:hypothetical protein
VDRERDGSKHNVANLLALERREDPPRQLEIHPESVRQSQGASKCGARID